MGFHLLNHEMSSVHAAALILGAAALLSRFLGVVRDRLLASHFGASRELDIYYAAFQIPDFLSVLFLLGAASAAILPVFERLVSRDRERARVFISALAALFLIVSSAVCLAAFFAIPRIIPIVAPGFSLQDQARAAALTRLMLVSPVLLGLSGIFSVAVQSFGRFAAYAAAPILYNLGIISGIVFLTPRFGIAGLGVGVAAGALLHCVLQIWVASRLGFELDVWASARRIFLRERQMRRELWEVVRVSGPRALSVGMSQLTIVALVAVGSLLVGGSVTIFNLAQNLYFVPIGIFGVSYATAVFPRLARAASASSGDDFFREFFSGVRSILFWAAPAAALFLVLRAHIVRLTLGAEAFSWDDTRLTAAVLAALCFAMAAGALRTFLVRGFYALGNTRIPLAVNAVASLVSVALAVAAARALGEGSLAGRALAEVFRIGDLPHPGVLGLGVGFAAGTVVDICALYFLLTRKAAHTFGRSPGIPGPGREIAKIAAAAVIAGLVAYGARAGFSETLPLITFARVLGQGAAAAGAGFAVYWAMLAWLGNEDVALIGRAITRRLFSLRILPPYWDSGEMK